MEILDEQFLREFVDWLGSRYYDEEQGAWTAGGQTEQDYLSSTFDFGNSFQVCLALVGPLQDAGHSVEMTGADLERLEPYRPDTIGLDWLVVDNRFVLDPWSYSHEGRKIVYDLQNAEDAKEVAALFPPRDQWSEAHHPDESQLETGRQLFHYFTLPRNAVDDLLGGLTER